MIFVPIYVYGDALDWPGGLGVVDDLSAAEAVIFGLWGLVTISPAFFVLTTILFKL